MKYITGLAKRRIVKQAKCFKCKELLSSSEKLNSWIKKSSLSKPRKEVMKLMEKTEVILKSCLNDKNVVEFNFLNDQGGDSHCITL